MPILQRQWRSTNPACIAERHEASCLPHPQQSPPGDRSYHCRAASRNLESCTLVLSGEADLDFANDIIQLGTLALNECTSLVIDLGAVTFMDSTAIGALLQLRNVAVLGNVGERVEGIEEPVFAWR